MRIYCQRTLPSSDEAMPLCFQGLRHEGLNEQAAQNSGHMGTLPAVGGAPGCVWVGASWSTPFSGELTAIFGHMHAANAGLSLVP